MGNMRIGPDNGARFIQSKYRQKILDAARPIWRFLRKCDRPLKSDAIFVFGSDRPAVADKAITLYRNGFAGKILFTGGVAGRFRLSEGISEAENFRNYALQKGVPGKDILVETRSSNTQENILKGIAVLRKKKIPFSRLILVSLPYQSLRQWATFEKLRQDWAAGLRSIEVSNCPANYTLWHVRDAGIFKAELDRMLGEIDRIMKYRMPPYEFMVYMDIPNDVMKAYHDLKRLIRGQC